MAYGTVHWEFPSSIRGQGTTRTNAARFPLLQICSVRPSVSERHVFAADWHDSGLGCQAAFFRDAEHSPRMLLRLLFGAEPLRRARGVASGQKLNSVIGHALLSHLAGPSAHYSLQFLTHSQTC
jgi:hypothetical protein